MKHKRFASYLVLAVGVLLVAIATYPAIEHAAPHSAKVQVRVAWDKAEDIGAYHYHTTVVQTTRPLPKLENVGLSSTTDRLYVEGEANRADESMYMRIWSGQASVLNTDQSIEVKVENGQTLGRIGGQQWQEVDDISSLFAPGQDPLGYLIAARNVQLAGTETRAGIEFTRFTFDVDGPAFADYMRKQMEQELARRGDLPQGVNLGTLDHYAGMVGSGELWVDGEGLPLRQSVNLTFPPDHAEQIDAEITTDFSGWNPGAQPPQILGMNQRQQRKVAGQVGLLFGFLGVGALILFNRRSRHVYAVVVCVVIASMLATPVLQAKAIADFDQEQRAQQAEYKAAQEVRQAAREAEAQRLSTDFDPRISPLDQARRTIPSNSSSLALWLDYDPSLEATAIVQAVEEEGLPDADKDGLPDADELAIGTDANDKDTDDDGLTDLEEYFGTTNPLDTDTDRDGLKDGVEVQELGTDPTSVDSDGDLISDPVEVRGFVDEYGTQWFLDPLSADTNGDSQIDSAECTVLADVQPNAQEWDEIIFKVPTDTACRDADGDHVPDVFDPDNDNDGVPDAVDDAPDTALGGGIKPESECQIAPYDGAGGRHADSTAGQTCIAGFEEHTFGFRIESFEARKPLFVDFQLRTANPDHLWYSMNVLDWPSPDEEGQVQRKKSTTFYDVQDPSKSGPKDRNGDMRLIPMLEIELPLGDAYANLPVRPGAPPPAQIKSTDPITSWVDTDKLDQFNITVRWKDEAGESLVALMPVVLINDPTGDSPVAFSARMLYQPQTSNWGENHQIRLVWIVQMLNDDGEMQFLHQFYDDWYLTGLNVRENHGVEGAIIYEDPQKAFEAEDFDSEIYVEDHLWGLVTTLDLTYMAARSSDGLRRDITIPEIKRRLDITTTATITESWGIPTATLHVDTFDLEHQGLLGEIGQYHTPEILSDTFSSWANEGFDAPMFLILREETSRSAALTGYGVREEKSYTLSLDDAEKHVMAGMQWAAYRYDEFAGQWSSYAPGDYWTERLQPRVESRTAQDPYFEAETAARTELWHAGAELLAESIFIAMAYGQASLVQTDGKPLERESAHTDDQLIEWGEGPEWANRMTETIAHTQSLIMMAEGVRDFSKVKQKWAADPPPLFRTKGGRIARPKLLRLRGKWVRARPSRGRRAFKAGGVAIGAAAVSVSIVATWTGDESVEHASTALDATNTAYTFTDATVSAVRATKKAGGSLAKAVKTAKPLTKFAKAAAVVGLVIEVGIAVGFFVYNVIASDMDLSSQAFREALADLIATIIVAVIMFAIGLIPIIGPIIVAIIGAIDLVVGLICDAVYDDDEEQPFWCAGISGLMTLAVKNLIYGYMVVADVHHPDHVKYGYPSTCMAPQDDSRGYVVSTTLKVTMPVTTTLIKGKPDSLYSLMAAAFGFFSDDNLKRSVMQQRLQVGDEKWHDQLGSLGSMKEEWKDYEYAQTVETTATLQAAGINMSAGVYASEAYKAPALECFSIPVCCFWLIPVCIPETEEDTKSVDIGIKFDVFPPTFEEFCKLVEIGPGLGYSFAWGQNGSPTMPPFADADGDGLRNPLHPLYPGNDPDDSTPDLDGDGLSDFYEIRHHSNPEVPDTDGDGLSDYEEARYGTEPTQADTDYDGLLDYEEIAGWGFVYGFTATPGLTASVPITTWVTSDPLVSDTDDDKIPDRLEQVYGYNPRVLSDLGVSEFHAEVSEMSDQPGNQPCATLTLERLTVDVAQRDEDEKNEFGDAEIAIDVDGIRVWYGEALKDGDVVDLNISRSCCRREVKLTLIEVDQGDYNNDTITDTLAISTTATTENLQLTPSGREGSVITLDYRVDSLGGDDVTVPVFEPTDGFVAPGQVLAYQATLGNQLQNRNVRGLFDADFLLAESDDALLEQRFTVGAQQETRLTGLVTVTADLDLSQVVSFTTNVNGRLDPDSHLPEETADPPPTPIFHVPFDEDGNITDVSPANVDITGLLGLPEIDPAAGRPGIVDRAAFFGKGQAVYADSSTLTLNQGEFTIAAWVRPTYDSPQQADEWGGIAGYLDPDDVNHSYPTLRITNTNPAWITGTASLNLTFGTGSSLCSVTSDEGVLSLGRWQHVAATFDQAGQIAFYVDGQQVVSDTTSCAGVTPYPQTRLWIGRSAATASFAPQRVEAEEPVSGTLGLYLAYDQVPTGTEHLVWEQTISGPGVYAIPSGQTAIDDDGPFYVLMCEQKDYAAPCNGDDVWLIRPGDLTVYGYHAGEGAEWYGVGILSSTSYSGTFYWDVDNHYYRGGLDDLRIYDQALTPDDVRELFAGTRITMEMRFDDHPGAITLYDHTGNRHHGSCEGDLCPLTGVQGRSGHAARFDGERNVVTLPTAEDLGLTEGPFTVDAWVRGEGSQPVSGTILATAPDTTPGLRLTVRDGYPYFELGSYTVQAEAQLEPGQWHHLAWTLDNDARNAALDASATQGGAEENHPADLGVDDDPWTYSVADGWWQVDLGKSINVDTVQVWFIDPQDPRMLDLTDPLTLTVSGQEYGLGGATPLPAHGWLKGVRVDVGRSGSYLRFDGSGRFAIADLTVTPAISDAMELAIYIDGHKDALETGVPTQTADAPVYVGGVVVSDSITGTALFRGEIDQLVIESKALHEALIQDRIAQRPLIHLPLDEPVGATGFENIADLANPGVCEVITCPQAGGKGRVGGAVVFDGQDDLVTLNGSELNREAFSVAMWVKPRLRKPTAQNLFARDESELNRLYIPPDSMHLQYNLCADGSYAQSALDLLPNGWNHVVLVYDSQGGVATLYQNGDLDSQADLAGSTCAITSSLLLGGAVDGHHFFGEMDEVSVYGYPLTDEDVAEMYAYQSEWFDADGLLDIMVDVDKPTAKLELETNYIRSRDMVMSVWADDFATPGVPYSGIGMAEYRVTRGSTITITEWTEATPDGDTWAFTFEVPDDDTYTIGVRATDKVGYVSDIYEHTLTVEATPPDMTLTLSGSDPIMPNEDHGIELSGTVSDAGSGVDSSSVLVGLYGPDGRLVSGSLAPIVIGSSWNAIYPSQFPLYGTYGVYLHVKDLVGNVFTDTIPVEIDGTPPTADITNVGGQENAITGMIHGTASDIPYRPRPAVHLHFEETISATTFYDGSPGRSHATCTDVACPASVSGGKFGRAVEFDGDDDALTIGNLWGGMDIEGNISLAAWIRPTSTTLTSTQVIIARGPAGGQQVMLRAADGQYQVGVQDGVATHVATTTIPTGDVDQWVHLAGTYDGLNWRLYRNGEKVSGAASTVGAISVNADWTVGAAHGVTNTFRGRIDEVLITNRVLDAQDVQALADPVGQGVERVEVKLVHLEDREDRDGSWQDATLGGAREIYATWTYTPADDIEGPYQVDLRVSGFGQEQEITNVWEGDIDTQAPRITLHRWGEHTGAGAGAYYACLAEDYSLTETGFDCPAAGYLNWAYQDADWFIELFGSAQKPFKHKPEGGAWLLDAGGPYTLTVTDLYGNSTAVSPTVMSKSVDPDVWITTPRPQTAFTSLAPIAVSGGAHASKTLDSLVVQVNGSPIHTQNWGGAVSQDTWSTTWTPSADGAYTITASVTDISGTVATNTDNGLSAEIGVLDTVIYVDQVAPQVSITTDHVGPDNYGAGGSVTVTGSITEAVGVQKLELQVNGGGWHPVALPAGGATTWESIIGTGTFTPPTGITWTLEARATDVADQVGQASRDVWADAAPPGYFALTLVYTDSGGILVTLRQNATITDVMTPTLEARWPAAAATVVPYDVQWTAIDTDGTETVVKSDLTFSRTSTYTATQLQKLKVRVKTVDGFGNSSTETAGPVYVDNSLTPAYVDMLVEELADRPYRNWLEDTCNLIGADYRREIRASAMACDDKPQYFYTTWDDEGLRLTWTGADWTVCGDLFIYLDVISGTGITQALNPYTTTHGNTVVMLPPSMEAETLIWAQHDGATVMEASGSEWVESSQPITYVFQAIELDTPHTDLFVPFTSLGVTDPASSSLKMVAFASEGGAMRLWATQPSGNSINSPRSTRIVGSRDFEQLALTQHYEWDSLGNGICPSGQITQSSHSPTRYPGTDVRFGISADPPGIAYSILGDNLYFEMPDLLPDLIDWLPDPTAPRALAETNRPAGLDYYARQELADVTAVNLPVVGDGQVIDYAIQYTNRGAWPVTGLVAGVRTWGPVRLLGSDGITCTSTISGDYCTRRLLLDDVAPGETLVTAFQGVISLTFDVDNQVGWATVDVVVHDDVTGSASVPLDWLYVDVAVDDQGPSFIELDPALALIPADDATFYGYVLDQSSVPTLTVKLNDTTFTCANESLAGSAWECSLDLADLNLSDGDAVDVWVRGTDEYGQQGTWSVTRTLAVDDIPPAVTLRADTANNFDDGLIGPNETTMNGFFSDDRLPVAVEVCHTSIAPDACHRTTTLVHGPPTTHIQEDAPSTPQTVDTCLGGGITRIFTVTDIFTITDLNVGLNISHTFRNDVWAYLESPAGTRVKILSGGSADQNYDVLLDDATAIPLSDDADDHNVGAPFYENIRRPTESLSQFNGENAYGEWKLNICDAYVGEDSGDYNRSRLIFTVIPSAAQSLGGTWQYYFTVEDGVGLPDQSLRVYAIDSAGNRSAPQVSAAGARLAQVNNASNCSAPQTLNYTLDTQPPVITFTTQREVAIVDWVFRMEGEVSDNIGLGGMFLKNHNWPEGGTTLEIITPTGTITAGTWVYETVLPEGEYPLYIEAFDRAGNSTEVPVWALNVVPPRNMYLPLTMRNYWRPPDLIVESIVAISNDVQVVIKNVGIGPVNDTFWIQAYIDPQPIPTRVNQIWYLGYSDYGLSWAVLSHDLPQLVPGGVLTLTISDAEPFPYSDFPATLPEGTPVYVQVDAYHPDTDYGAVLEDHEFYGGNYNNIDSTISVLGAADEVGLPTSEVEWPTVPHGLPALPTKFRPRDVIGNK